MITTTAADFIELADVQAFLQKRGTLSDSDTAKLQTMVDAACQMIVDRVGQVSTVTAVETITAPGPVIVLDDRPVIEITAVDGDDLDALEITNKDGGLLAYTGSASSLTLTYTCGRDPIPGTIAEAGLELATHLWRGSQNASGGAVPMGDSDATDMQFAPGSAYALPIRVRELLGLGRNLPRDEVLVG